MISDMVVQIAGDKVNLKSLMGPGVDPHLYEPIPTDAIALVEADIIFYNGLKLEGQDDLRSQKPKRNSPRIGDQQKTS